MDSTGSSERPRKAAKASLNFAKLFEKPSSWSHEHLSLLNIKEYHDVDPVGIIGDAYLPLPDNEVFTSFATDFAHPTRHEILTTQDFPNNRFKLTLSKLWLVGECAGNFSLSTSVLYSIAYNLHVHTDRLHLLTFNPSPIEFKLLFFNIKGTLGEGVSYVSSTDTKRKLPHVMFRARSSQENRNAACEVMPYLLLQIILAYEKNPALNFYTAFVITLKGPTSQFITASCSVSYIHDMVSTRMPRASLEVKFSLPYNLLEPEDRWEFMRLYYGLLQYLYERLKSYDA